jgi:hypothetical protein
MSVWSLVAVILAGIPLGRALWANRHTALAFALIWAALAWVGWIWNVAAGELTARYLSLCLTACAGIAVLGARRPGVIAWNVVVGGLLAVLLVPLGQDFVAGTSWLTDAVWKTFLGIVLGAGTLNYLPTRLWPASLALLAACLLELAKLESSPRPWLNVLAIDVAALALWLSWGLTRMARATDKGCDRLWQQFRDRFGFVWAQRVREQFNAAVQHANMDVDLAWSGPRTKTGAAMDENQTAAARQLLVALMQRFGMP